MAVNLSPIWGAGAQLLDNSGNVLSGGKIYTYAAGTTTPAATYTSSTGGTANSNPIVLNSAGRVPYEIWMTDGVSYKFVLKDSNDTLIATYDNLTGINSNYIAFTMQQEIQTATAGQTVFNLTTMEYQPGTNSLAVYVDGVNQYGPGAQYAYVETDSDTVTFVSGLHVGASVKFTTAASVSSNYANAAQVTYDPPFTDAVATNVEAKLSESVSVKDFGAVGDGITDDTDAIQAALTYAYNNAPSSGWRTYSANIYFPHGQYRIAQANTLFAGLTNGSFNITGDGKFGVTEIIYDVPSAGANDYLIYNDDSIGFTQFNAILFSSANVTTNQNFMYYNSDGQAQNFTFNQCEFRDFSLIFDVQGSAGASENTFYNCKFTGFSDCAFRLNNAQSVNWRFYSCDSEVFTGTLFEFNKGATVFYSQGSVIPTASTSRIIKIPSSGDYNSFGPGNAPQMQFQNTRFEMRSGSLMTQKDLYAANFRIVYDCCGMGGYNIPDPATYKMFTWSGAGWLELRTCKNMANYLISHTANGSDTTGDLIVVANGCDLPTNFVSGSTFTITGATTNVGVQPLFSIQNCGIALDGMYKAADSQYMNNSLSNKQEIVQTKHAISFSSLAAALAVCNKNTTFNVTVPPTRISGFELYPTAVAGYGSTQATVTITNAAGTTTLATFNWVITTPVSVKLTQDCNYYVDAFAGDYIKVNITHNYATDIAAQFGANLYAIY